MLASQAGLCSTVFVYMIFFLIYNLKKTPFYLQKIWVNNLTAPNLL